MRLSEAFLSRLNLIFVIAGVAALVGAGLSLAVIRSRDLHPDARDGSAAVPELDAAERTERPALAA